jgi:hypothetical protein
LFVEVPQQVTRSRHTPIPLVWMHGLMTHAAMFGDVVETTETDEGLAIKGRFDLDTEFGKSGLPQALDYAVA